jgi:N-acetylglucosaminyl-diphospho-decaprenol L-rhamnosyltransferase
VGAGRAGDARGAAGGGLLTTFAIVTVIHDSEQELAGLLDSVGRLPDPPPRFVVVDSGSSDGGAALAEERGADVVRLDGNRGFGAGCNAGIERVSEPVTALVNPDVELLDDGLARLAADALAGGALLAPRLLNADGSVQDSAHPLPGRLGTVAPAVLPRRLLPTRFEPWRGDRPGAVGWAVAACMVGRTDELRALGPFDPDAFLFYEDMELCLHARREGVPTLLVPAVRVRHLGGTSTGRSLGAQALDMHARRRREVMARQGRLPLMLDDLAELLTHGIRAVGRALVRRDPEPARRRLRALLRAWRG